MIMNTKEIALKIQRYKWVGIILALIYICLEWVRVIITFYSG